MGIKVANNAFATLAAGITNSATSITVASGQGARFPTLGAGDYFYATLINTSNQLEIVKCTARSGDVLTVVRAQESTTARSYDVGDRIEIRITAATFEDATSIYDVPTDSTGYFQVPRGTTAQRPASPETGMVRFNTDLNYLEEFRGGIWQALSNVFVATGGTETTVNVGGVDYKVHTFTSSGTFTVLSGTAQVEYLVVGGGGAGGNDYDSGTSAGGGAGGYRCSVSGESSGGGASAESSLNLATGTYAVIVGAGGAIGTSGTNARGNQGSNSSFAGIVSIGGGGGSAAAAGNATSGGSGGGQSNSATGGAGTAGQGYAGNGDTGNNVGRGGGGAGEAPTLNKSTGNNGVSSNITGTSVTRAGGGGGAGDPGSTNVSGGAGGGGTGGNTGGTSGSVNTGSGGGGASADNDGGAGGSGIVIVRYQL